MVFKYLICLILISFYSFSQTTISGKLSFDNKPISDCIIELKINKTSKFSITDKSGIYLFSNIVFHESDSVFISVKHLDYNDFVERVNFNTKIVVDIKLEKKVQQLKEVVIKNELVKNKASKSIYKINQKDYLSNAKASDVLTNLPNVYSNKLGETIVDGKLSAKIFIDGIEQLRDEINTIDAKDIQKIEIITNPSSSYGSDFFGAIINIITKKESSNYFKGNLATTLGYRNNFKAISPTLVFKKKYFTIKSFSEYKEYKQQVDYLLFRNKNSSIYELVRKNYSQGIQKFSNTKAKIDFAKKSSLTFSNSLYGYTFYGDAFGTINSNSLVTNYTDKSKDKYENWDLSSVYKYLLSENRNLFFKCKYESYNIENKFDYLFDTFETERFYTKSLNKEFSTSLNYEVEDFTIFEKTSSFYADAKYINRNFSFSNTNFYINQNVFNTSLEIDNEWNEKFSTDVALTIENTTNFNSQLRDAYTMLLPNFNGLYHFKNKLDSRIGYSRKVLRPDADELNDDLVAINPGIAKQGNSRLDPQIRNYYYISFSKAFKTENIAVKFFNESINNAIVETFKNQDELLLQTLENAAKFNSTGFNVSFRTKILKKINANFNSGLDFNSFEDNSKNAIVKKNSGITSRYSASLNTKLFKDKLAVSFSARNNNPTYSLLSKTESFAYVDLSLTTNLFSDKIGLNLYFKDLTTRSSNKNEFTNYKNFEQRIGIINNFSNILLSITYNFGKKFEAKIDSDEIQNNDVRK